MATIAELVTGRMELNRKIEREERAHKKHMAPAYALLNRLENQVLDYLNTSGVKNIAVDGVATAFKKRKVSVTVADWDVAWAEIVRTERWDMLNHAVNKTVVEAIIKDTGEIPPGVNYAVTTVAQFQRAPGTGDDDDENEAAPDANAQNNGTGEQATERV